MTDNEIIKALECCSLKQGECKECPCDSVMDCDCEEMLLREAFYLINRQKAEIEKKDTEIDILIRKKETLRDEISELTAEVERLKKFIEKDQGLILKLTGVPVEEYNSKIKTEAYREFAERLKESPSVTNCENEWMCLDIDNLLKELIGESK